MTHKEATVRFLDGSVERYKLTPGSDVKFEADGSLILHLQDSDRDFTGAFYLGKAQYNEVKRRDRWMVFAPGQWTYYKSEQIEDDPR